MVYSTSTNNNKTNGYSTSLDEQTNTVPEGQFVVFLFDFLSQVYVPVSYLKATTASVCRTSTRYRQIPRGSHTR